MNCTILIFVTVLFLFSCVGEKSGFTAKPQKKGNKFHGNIRIDGGYWGVYDRPTTSSLQGKEMGCFFLYNNGIALWYPAISYQEDSARSDSWVRKKIIEQIDLEKSFFKDKVDGGYSFDSDPGKIQIYVYTKYKWELCTMDCRIINDSALYIGQCQIEESKGYCRENYYLRFIRMPKPDSINRLMKKNWYWQ